MRALRDKVTGGRGLRERIAQTTSRGLNEFPFDDPFHVLDGAGGVKTSDLERMLRTLVTEKDRDVRLALIESAKANFQGSDAQWAVLETWLRRNARRYDGVMMRLSTAVGTTNYFRTLVEEVAKKLLRTR